MIQILLGVGNCVRWHIPIILALQRLRQKDQINDRLLTKTSVFMERGKMINNFQVINLLYLMQSYCFSKNSQPLSSKELWFLCSMSSQI